MDTRSNSRYSWLVELLVGEREVTLCLYRQNAPIDLRNAGENPDVSLGFVALDFPGGSEDQYTFGAPGLNFWREQGQVTLYVKTRLGAGMTMRNLAESYAGVLRARFCNDRFVVGNGTVRIVSTAPIGGGHDEVGLWGEAVALGYETYNVG